MQFAICFVQLNLVVYFANSFANANNANSTVRKLLGSDNISPAPPAPPPPPHAGLVTNNFGWFYENSQINQGQQYLMNSKVLKPPDPAAPLYMCVNEHGRAYEPAPLQSNFVAAYDFTHYCQPFKVKCGDTYYDYAPEAPPSTASGTDSNGKGWTIYRTHQHTPIEHGQWDEVFVERTLHYYPDTSASQVTCSGKKLTCAASLRGAVVTGESTDHTGHPTCHWKGGGPTRNYLWMHDGMELIYYAHWMLIDVDSLNTDGHVVNEYGHSTSNCPRTQTHPNNADCSEGVPSSALLSHPKHTDHATYPVYPINLDTRCTWDYSTAIPELVCDDPHEVSVPIYETPTSPMWLDANSNFIDGNDSRYGCTCPPPSVAPTAAPTIAPTVAPTTIAPTEVPTEAPTASCNNDFTHNVDLYQPGYSIATGLATNVLHMDEHNNPQQISLTFTCDKTYADSLVTHMVGDKCYIEGRDADRIWDKKSFGSRALFCVGDVTCQAGAASPTPPPGSTAAGGFWIPTNTPKCYESQCNAPSMMLIQWNSNQEITHTPHLDQDGEIVHVPESGQIEYQSTNFGVGVTKDEGVDTLLGDLNLLPASTIRDHVDDDNTWDCTPLQTLQTASNLYDVDQCYIDYCNSETGQHPVSTTDL